MWYNVVWLVGIVVIDISYTYEYLQSRLGVEIHQPNRIHPQHR